MPNIFVDTDHNPKNKLYDGSKAGAAATKVEAKMQSVVKGVIGKTAGFTTTKDANSKGYIVRLEISKLTAANGKTDCKLSGSITRYPKGVTMSGAKGDEMVTTGWAGHGIADGTDDGALIFCVKSVVEDMLKKNGIQAMRNDMLKR